MSTKKHRPPVILDGLIDALNAVLPYQPWADKVIHWLRFYLHHGRRPTSALRYNDVLYQQTTSAYGRARLVVQTSCKLEVKSFLKTLLPEQHVIPTLAVLKTKSEVDAYEFPEACVVKGTAASGQVILKTPGTKIDRRTLKKWLNTNHYTISREANYKPLKNMIIVEPIVGNGGLADDIKIGCYGGRSGWVLVNKVNDTPKTRLFFDLDWRNLRTGKNFPLCDEVPRRPEPFDEMVAAADKIADHFGLVRVDFFVDGRRWWIGELTHVDGAALSSFLPLKGEHLTNVLLFGDDAYAGPYETHGALFARGPEPDWPDMGLEPPDAAYELGLVK